MIVLLCALRRMDIRCGGGWIFRNKRENGRIYMPRGGAYSRKNRQNKGIFAFCLMNVENFFEHWCCALINTDGVNIAEHIGKLKTC